MANNRRPEARKLGMSATKSTNSAVLDLVDVHICNSGRCQGQRRYARCMRPQLTPNIM